MAPIRSTERLSVGACAGSRELDGALADCLSFDTVLPGSYWAIVPSAANGSNEADAAAQNSSPLSQPQLSPPLPCGRLLLHGACVAAGYLDLPSSQASTLAPGASGGDCIVEPSMLSSPQTPAGPLPLRMQTAGVARTLQDLQACDGFVRVMPTLLSQLTAAGGCAAVQRLSLPPLMQAEMPKPLDLTINRVRKCSGVMAHAQVPLQRLCVSSAATSVQPCVAFTRASMQGHACGGFAKQRRAHPLLCEQGCGAGRGSRASAAGP